MISLFWIYSCSLSAVLLARTLGRTRRSSKSVGVRVPNFLLLWQIQILSDLEGGGVGVVGGKYPILGKYKFLVTPLTTYPLDQN